VFSVGDEVIVDMPHGLLPGKVVQVMPHFLWFEETHYEVHGNKKGKEFVTTCSARLISKAA